VAGSGDSFSRVELRRLLAVSERQLKSWEKQKLIAAATVYGFRELIALRTLVRLRQDRVPPMQIRRALAALRVTLRHVSDPLTDLKLYADGKKFAWKYKAARWTPSRDSCC
jgi:DNA-binding transcriptional MerR regulator